MSKEAEIQDIPDTIYDPNAKITYKKGRFFGKGGFARCYEIIDLKTNGSFAGKVVSKSLMKKQNQREKMTQEIQIHQTLKHVNVVGFHSFFDDSMNIYIVLELCRKRSMMELHKRRRAITEPETRFYLKQIFNGVHYLHQNRIIHRDLKLGNLFLDDELTVKIGDFGLAAKIEHDGERKKTLCGTPNYIAPEILNKKGHSFEVDIWSLGCIAYTLLVGRPPFETSSLKETYSRIQKCEYKLTTNISSLAKSMIMTMLQPEPKSRPKAYQLIHHEFIVNGYCPTSLPISALTMAPRFDKIDVINNRKALSPLNNKQINKDQNSITTQASSAPKQNNEFNGKDNFIQLRSMLLNVLKTKPARNVNYLEEMSDPASQPVIWVSKWVDYSDKYGFGYQLSDEGVGVMFNDTTKIILLPNRLNVHYIDKYGEESYMTVNDYPRQYDKKIKLLSYFSRYMKEHLVRTGDVVVKESDSLARTPHLHQWCRSTSGVLMQLNNGTVQMNFSDHTKIIMCPLMAAITYIDTDKTFRTYKFTSIEKNGCSVGLYEKMRYAYDKISVLLDENYCK